MVMRKEEAKRYVCRTLSTILEHDLTRGADYLDENLLETDKELVQDAARELSKELRERSR